MKKNYLLLCLLAVTLLTAAISSCKKLDYDNGFATFGEVIFDKNNATGSLKIRYAGAPLDWADGSGKVRVPVGERKFEFYDDKTGATLGEKTVNVVAGEPETFLIFRPDENAPLAFLDPNAQNNEPAPPEGFMKIKIANYAKKLIPFDKVDIIVTGINANFEFINVDTLESIGQNLGDENFHLVPTGGADMLAWTFSFREHGTENFVMNHGGTVYANQGNFLYPDMIDPYPAKRIYTIYMTPFDMGFEYEAFIKNGDSYYDINPTILFSN